MTNTKIFKERVLILENKLTYLYLAENVRSKFDRIVILENEYYCTLTDAQKNPDLKYRLPVLSYTPEVNPDSVDLLKTAEYNKVTYVKIKDIDLGENNGFFVVGKFAWFFLKELQDCHVGLRNTNADWQIVHLHPFTMGSNKFVFSHTLSDEYYKKNSEIFWDDELLSRTVAPLKKSKTLTDYDSITKALRWAIDRDTNTRFGLDYETNGLWKSDQYENLIPVGVGIATKAYGFYIDFRFLSNEELTEVKKVYKEFLDKHYKNCWVFNLSFEMLVTRKFLGEWALYEFKDADIWRIIHGDQINYTKKIVEDKYARGSAPKMKEVKSMVEQRWSLKYTTQKYLGVGSWDNDFEWIETKLDKVFNGYEFKSISEILKNRLVGNYIHSIVKDGTFSDSEITNILKKMLAKKNVASRESIDEIFSKEPKSFKPVKVKVKKGEPEPEPVEPRIYNPQDYSKHFYLCLLGSKDKEDIIKHPDYLDVVNKYSEFEEEFLRWLDDPLLSANQFSIQPSEILGTYCILDAYYTLMIAEKHYAEDLFEYSKYPDRIGAKWMTTQKMVDLFNGNKSIGAKLDIYGLFKSNATRDSYMLQQYKNRVFANFVVAEAYYKILLDGVNTDKHPNEKLLEPIFVHMLDLGQNPLNFDLISKTIFPLIYDESKPFGWNEEIAEKYFGDMSEEIKEILLSEKPKGFENKSAHSRAINLHKEVGSLFEELWNNQNLPKDFNIEELIAVRGDLSKAGDSVDKLNTLKSCSISGKTLEEVHAMDNFTIDGMVYDFETGHQYFKKNIFDMNANNEIRLGALTERWKAYKILLFLYHPKQFKEQIDSMKLWTEETPLEERIVKFHKTIQKIYDEYEYPNYGSGELFENYELEAELQEEYPGDKFQWMVARKYARDNKLGDKVENPDISEFNEPVQVDAYLRDVTSAELGKLYGANVGLLETYEAYASITEDQILHDKAFLDEEFGASPMAYVKKYQEKGELLTLHDDLAGKPKGYSIEKSKTADFDLQDETAFVKLATLFKYYRKFEKQCQYLEGQLVKDDERMLGLDSDGVPRLAGLTMEEKLASVAGDNVKMYPSYQMLQKFTKRNSSGIHTVPSKSQFKSVIQAPEDSLLVYTDISGMELKGIASISNDPVMLQYFAEGKDIYVQAAIAYHNDYMGKNMPYDEVKKQYRNAYKGGVISTIYTAGDFTLANFYGVKVHEVKHIKNAIFDKFQVLYEWQQNQILYNKQNRGNIKTYLGDFRRTFEENAKQTRQAIKFVA